MLDTLILRDQVTTSQLILVLAHGQQHLHVEPSCMVDFGVGGPKAQLRCRRRVFREGRRGGA